jgi:hypothetical protein
MLDRRPGGISGFHCGSFVEREIKSPLLASGGISGLLPMSSPVANWNALPLRLFD